MLSTQLQNGPFHDAERTRMSAAYLKMKNACAKHAKLIFFHSQTCKFVKFLLPSSLWLLKLPINFLELPFFDYLLHYFWILPEGAWFNKL